MVKRARTREQKSKTARGSKAKGSSFERQVCKRLSLWVTGGARDDCFWRAAMSGGRATVRAKRGALTKNQCGDISAVSVEGLPLLNMFLISCKHYRNLSIQSAMLDWKGPLARFWEEAVVEAKTHNKSPMLIAKENRTDTIVLLYREQARDVFLYQRLATIWVNKAQVEIIKFDDLLSGCFDHSCFAKENQ